MNNFQAWLKRPLTLNKWYLVAFLLIALIGFSDATYLTITHLSGKVPTCSVIEGCDVVTTSKYSEIFGIPVALGGSIFYLSMILLVVLHFDNKKSWPLRLAFVGTTAGLLASIYFSSIMAFVLKAICVYCVGSAISSTTLFIIGMCALYKNRNLPHADQN